ncbi:MAG: L-seryl-tRNA(Sec) selenium transferase, partial [Firmicutes bacterium]|nr:L-seryl-tRNA(Sec) selenium transferase [Bacillota bacterium]
MENENNAQAQDIASGKPDYSNLPKIDKLILLLTKELGNNINHPLLVAAAREAVSALRQELSASQFSSSNKETLLDQGLALTRELYTRKNITSLRRVINATGIVLHTNLGRAVLSEAARQAVDAAALGYCNLELDLASGKRSSRYEHVAELLKLLTGAEDSLVVNNNAAAVLLALDTLAKGGEAVVSRGELVEIGGSF